MSRRYLLFGTGDYYQRYKKWFDKHDIAALVDNSEKKQGTYIDGIMVLSPENAVKCAFDYVIILSFYVIEMRKQLIDLGVDAKKIYHFFDLHDLIYQKSIKREIQYWGEAKEIVNTNDDMTRKVLLLSHDLTLGGPALALMYIARTLSHYGYEIVFGSMLDGSLRELLLSEGISVIVDENLQLETMREASWTSKFDLIICNTISYYVYLSERELNIPIIWWLHDSDFFYGGVNKEKLRIIDRTKLEVVSVGPVPRNAIKKYIPDMEIKDLIYGVEDFSKVNILEKKKTKIRFITIGYVEARKGQDVLIEAVRSIPVEERNQCEFFLVGQNTSMLAQKIQREIKDLPQIIMTGSVDRKQIHFLLENSDVMICPSREDPMPTVAAEAMMHSVPCLISDATGTAGYIENGKDGWIFESENVMELAQHICWCVGHRQEILEMGKEARKLYENTFSVRVFERNLLDLVESMI